MDEGGWLVGGKYAQAILELFEKEEEQEGWEVGGVKPIWELNFHGKIIFIFFLPLSFLIYFSIIITSDYFYIRLMSYALKSISLFIYNLFFYECAKSQ